MAENLESMQGLSFSNPLFIVWSLIEALNYEQSARLIGWWAASVARHRARRTSMATCYSEAYELIDVEPEVAPRAVSKAGAAGPFEPPSAALPGAAVSWPQGGATDETTEEERSDEPLPPAARLLYVQSARLQELSWGLPVNQSRSCLVHSLACAAGLLAPPLVEVAEARPASIEQLREYHSLEYLAALAHAAKLRPVQLEAVGLVDDCTPFPGYGGLALALLPLGLLLCRLAA